MKTYRVNSNPNSFKGVLKQLRIDAYKDNKEKMEQLVARLAELGASKVSLYINNSSVDGTQGKGYTAYLEPTRNGYKIVAKGENIIMAEFGTGNRTIALDSLENGAEIVREGSWSETHAKQYAEKGYWFYKNTKYTGETGAHAFHFAKQDMIKAIESIANEVFND